MGASKEVKGYGHLKGKYRRFRIQATHLAQQCRKCKCLIPVNAGRPV